MKKDELDEPYESLYRIQRALTGCISYLAACNANIVFSEYLLYDPILRVLSVRNYNVECEYSCADFLPGTGKGDHKRIDFVAKKNTYRFALEVKWPKKLISTLDVNPDYEKLAAFQNKYANSKSFLCIFGRYNHINRLNLSRGGFVAQKSLPPNLCFFSPHSVWMQNLST
jgi:hypothetical protein